MCLVRTPRHLLAYGYSRRVACELKPEAGAFPDDHTVGIAGAHSPDMSDDQKNNYIEDIKMKFTPEHLEKAKQAKSAEELIALAKENGIEIGGFRLIIITDFFILALRFLEIRKKPKKAVALFRNASYK